jgi:hypothetical protein
MSEVAVEYIALFAFFLLLFAAVLAEIMWLTRKGWTNSGRAVGYVLLTDLLSLTVGFTIAFIAFFVMFMMVMGPAGRGGTAPEAAYVVVTIIAVAAPAIFLFFAKRLGLLIFKIRTGKSAWIFSLVSSLLLLIVVLVPPPLIYYLIATIIEWKR